MQEKKFWLRQKKDCTILQQKEEVGRNGVNYLFMENELTIVYKEMIRINPDNCKEIQTKGLGMGSCWRHRFTPSDMGQFIKLEFEEPTLALIAKTENGSYYSTNGGRNWRKIEEEDE